jgi:transcriptional regulator with XRE-family HTH domain
MLVALPSPPSLPDSSLSFCDSNYLMHVIDYLTRTRIEHGMSRQELALRARIHPSVIDQVEQHRRIPNTQDFKAWSAALGLSWNQVWSDCLPKIPDSSIEHFTSQPPFSPRDTVSRAPMRRARY